MTGKEEEKLKICPQGIVILLLILFLAFAVLDTLYFKYEVSKVEETEDVEAVSDALDVTSLELSDGAIYYDGNITIREYEKRYKDTDIHIAELTLSDVSYLKTAFAKDSFGKNIGETVKSQAQRKGALIAINGDYYGAREKGYVIRNGVLYQESSRGKEDLCIYKDGSFEIVKEGKISAKELLDKGAWQVFSFGPVLVRDGEINVGVNDEVAIASPSNPRTCIGIIDKLHYVLIVSDGRTEDNAGLSLYELAEYLKDLGVTIGYNLDGGGSSTMVYMDQVINFPNNSGKYYERKVSDIVYIGY